MISLQFISHVPIWIRAVPQPGRAKSSKVQAWSFVKTPSKMSDPCRLRVIQKAAELWVMKQLLINVHIKNGCSLLNGYSI